MRATPSLYRRTCLLSVLTAAFLLLGQPTLYSPLVNAATGNPYQVYLPQVVRPAPSAIFRETFDGDPTSPQPWSSANWDVVIHSRAVTTWDALEAVDAGHGADCAPTPATHTVTRYEDAVFNCKNHLMTAIKASDYGVIYLTPNQLLDFSSGTATVRWDMSTLRTSARDWVDVWISPFNDQLELPLDQPVDLSGPPRNAIHIEMDIASSAFIATIYRDFVATRVSGDLPGPTYESFLTPDGRRRDTFEIQLSRTTLKMGMPAYNVWWADTSFPSLSWSQGVVQFGHHSYNPLKENGCQSLQIASPADCKPNTWHWDNITLTPVKPFTLIKATQHAASGAKGASVSFDAPAPANAHLRFAGIGTNLEVSFDGGKTWQVAQIQAQDPLKLKEEHFRSYWVPIPTGVQQVQLRGQNWYSNPWYVRDLSIWVPPTS